MKIIDTDNTPITLEDFNKMMLETKQNFVDKIFPKGIYDYNASYALLHPWLIINHMGLEIKWTCQRVFRGWDDRVVWSIDYYLANMIPQWLNQLIEKKQGIPMTVLANYPMDENYNTTPEDFDLAQKQWDAIVKTIIVGFESYKQMNDLNPDSEEYKKRSFLFNVGFNNFKKHFVSLWD